MLVLKNPKLSFKVSDFFKISWITFSVVTFTILVFLSEWIQRTGLISMPSGFRHIVILVLFLFNWLLFGRQFRLNQFYVLGIFMVFGYLAVAYIFVPVTALNYILGTVFTFLFMFIFVLASNTRTKSNVIINIFTGLIVFFVITSMWPIIKVLITGSTLRHSYSGLFRELGAFGSVMNMGVILCLSLFIITKEKKYIYFAIFLSFGVFLTVLKKTMFSNLIVWFVFSFIQVSQKNRLKMLLYGISFIIFSFSFVGDEVVKDIKVNISYYKSTVPAENVRLGMYIASFKIACDYFPFGSGMGTFGSLASLINGYSEIYYKYGVSKIGMNSQKDYKRGQFTLLDTYWPHILGELGFIGTILFLILWLYPLISASYILYFCNVPMIRGLCFYIVVLVLTMINEGFTLYTPEIPSFILLHSGVAGLCYYHIKNYKNAVADENNLFDSKTL
jgi:hypothetical protein